MNAPERSRTAKASFQWDDPLLLEQQLTADERMVRDAARAYAQDKLAPRILEAFRHEKSDPSIFREMGALGIRAFGLSMASGGLSWLGDHVRAYAFAGEAIELLETLGYAADPGAAFEVAAEECAGRGMHEEAGRLLDRARRKAARRQARPAAQARVSLHDGRQLHGHVAMESLARRHARPCR